jgi:hypothetical protein
VTRPARPSYRWPPAGVFEFGSVLRQKASGKMTRLPQVPSAGREARPVH